MKKLLSLFLVLALLVAVVGCSMEAPEVAAKEKPAEQAQQPAQAEQPAQNEKPAQDAASAPEPVADAAFGKGLKIGFSDITGAGIWGIRLEESIIGLGQKYGFEIVFADANSDVAKQLADIEDFIAQNVDFIILHAVDSAGASSALQQAKKANVPVILVGREVVGVPGDDYVCYLCSDGEWEGLAAASTIAAKHNGKAKVVELTGTMGASIAQERYNGFHKGLEQFPDLELVSSQTANFTRAEAQKVMENIIQSTDGKFEAVYAHNDEMALGALQAIKAAGLKDITIVGIDAQADAFDAIRAGDMYATITHNPFYGEWVYDIIKKIIDKKETPIKIVRKDYVITKENVDSMSDYAL